MNSLYKICITLLAISISLYSCEDAFTTTLEIDPPEHKDKLVVHAYGSTNGMDLNVHLTKSTGLLENNNNDVTISGAEITLWKEDELVAQLEEVNINGSNFRYNYILPEGSVTYEKGSTYRLEVIADGFDKAVGTTIVPNDIPLLKQRFEEDGTSLESGDFNSEVEIEFQDPAGQEDFYEVGVALYIDNGGNPFYQEVRAETYDPSGQEGLSYANLIINDLSFDGELKTFPLIIERFDETAIDNMFVLWRITSEGHYLFNKTAKRQDDLDDNPFSSPVQVYSNIENGIGIFSIMNESFVKVNL